MVYIIVGGVLLVSLVTVAILGDELVKRIIVFMREEEEEEGC